MKLYHGTGVYNLDSFIREGIKLKHRNDFKRPSFCASLSLKEAEFFALRKTPANDLKKTGVVLEFETKGMVEGESEDFIRYRDRVLRDEQEIVIFNPKKLVLVAYHRFTSEGWKREELEGEVAKRLYRGKPYRMVCKRCGWCCLAQGLFVRFCGKSVIDPNTHVCRFLGFERADGKIIAGCKIWNDPKRPSKCKKFYCQDCVEILDNGKWIPLLEWTKGVLPINSEIFFYPKLTTPNWTELRDNAIKRMEVAV